MNSDKVLLFHGLDQRETEGRCIVLFVEVESWKEDYIRYFFVVGTIFVDFEVDLSISFVIPIGISFDDKFGFINIL
jgi:hypothetical protein